MHSEAATGFGGQERRIVKEMVAMREAGHHLEAICQPDAILAKKLIENGFKVHTMYMDGAKNYCSAILKTRKILKKGSFNVLNTHSRRDTMIAGLAARLAKTPLIVRTRHLARKPNSLLSYTKIPHRVTTTSEFVRQQLLDKNVPNSFVQTVYSPVDIKPSDKKNTVRSELNLNDSDIIVGCVAVLRKPKGHAELIKAMQPLFSTNKNLHLVIVGGGTEVFEQIQNQINELQLQNHIHMLGSRSDVPDLLADFDIFALATREEASGTVFVEAGAAGLPIVATNVGGVSETLLNNESGFLIELDDENSLQTAIKKLVENPDLRKKMGSAGFDFYTNSGRFTIDGLVKKTESAYYTWLKDLGY